MRKITLTITAFVTEEGFMDEIDSVLDDGSYREDEVAIDAKDTYKITSAIDNKWVEIVSTQVKVEQANINQEEL